MMWQQRDKSSISSRHCVRHDYYTSALFIQSIRHLTCIQHLSRFGNNKARRHMRLPLHAPLIYIQFSLTRPHSSLINRHNLILLINIIVMLDLTTIPHTNIFPEVRRVSRSKRHCCWCRMTEIGIWITPLSGSCDPVVTESCSRPAKPGILSVWSLHKHKNREKIVGYRDTCNVLLVYYRDTYLLLLKLWMRFSGFFCTKVGTIVP